MNSRLFKTDLPELRWQEFTADGFSHPVSGIVYRAGQSSCGLPLGGIGTGCMDLDTDGTFGRCSIFNSFMPPRNLNLPFLALACGEETWVLSRQPVSGAKSVGEVYYWGHYPVADLEFEIDGPVSVGLRALSPFVPGDAAVSNTPGAVFELRLRNTSDTVQSGCIALSFPGPTPEEASADRFQRCELSGPIRGIEVTCETGVGYALAAVGDANIRVGGALSSADGSWARIASQLPEALEADAGACLAVDFQLEARSEQTVHFVLAWYAPRWVGTEEHHYLHAYTTRFQSAAAVAEFLAGNHQALLGRILSWQEVIYTSGQLPAWLRDQLVNVLHTITEDSFWAANSIPPEDWSARTGIFGLTESPRTTPHVAIPSDWYGGQVLVFFFPDLMRALLRAYVHFQLPNGEIALGIGSGTDLQTPIYHCLHTTNASNFVDLVDRLWQRDRDESILREFYPAVKKAIDYCKTLDRDGDGLLDLDPEPGGNQFYGAWLWYGTATHPDGFWLAALKMAQRMAEELDDRAFAHDCRVWFELGSRSLEEKLWHGQYYLLYHDTATGRKSDTILANQLAGQWLAYLHGLSDVFPADRVQKVLATVKRLNFQGSQWGALNAIRPDGSIDQGGPRHSTEIFPAENLCVAMTCMYTGDRTTGEELAERVMNNVILRQRAHWDMPNMVDPQSGQITHGTDFYQMMMQWNLPLALAGQDIAAACAPGGLVDRILKAARAD